MRVKKSRKVSLRQSFARNKWILVCVILAVLVGGAWYVASRSENPVATMPTAVESPTKTADPKNPLSNRKFYRDDSRQVTKLVAQYQGEGKVAEAELLSRIASQPGTTWLTGPSDGDPSANRDIKTVERTSGEAAAQGTVPMYELYAIPGRDACAGYSKGGFQEASDYLSWVGRLTRAFKTDVVISLEADAIAHTIGDSSCISAQQKEERYALLKQAVTALKQSPRVLAVYIDAGHPDWLPDPSVLIEPLRKSGIEQARGIAANVSFFAETSAVTAWSAQLIDRLGADKGAVIDTSRNGRGILAASGDAQWCNPVGRGLGPRPTTLVEDKHIDAYFWGKNVGESDGACAGYPAAGTFVPSLALELARNAVQP